jgi:hypothetical protein
MTARGQSGSIAPVNDDDFGDEFVFSPEPWDLAMAIGLEPEERDREALEELADAMLVWAEGPVVEALTAKSVSQLWTRELETEIRQGLARAAALGDDWRPAVEAAAAEFERDPVRAPVTTAVVQRLAMDLGMKDAPLLFCLCCIDEAVEAALPTERRSCAVQAALVAVRDASVSPEEVKEALLANAASRLGTLGRRSAVRRRLGRLASLGHDSLPALAAELAEIAVEDLGDDAGADDVWEVVEQALLAQVTRPELN